MPERSPPSLLQRSAPLAQLGLALQPRLGVQAARFLETSPLATTSGDLRVVVYAVAAGFAVLGARMGASGALVALVGTAAAAFAVPWQWPRIASLASRLPGPLAARIGSTPAMAPDAAVGSDMAWPVAVFVGAVLLSHIAGALATEGPRAIGSRRLQRLADRLMGAALGGLTGLLVARFVFGRLALQPALQTWPAETAQRGSLGAALVVVAVILLIGLYGVLSMGSRRPQVFDG